MLSFTCDYTQGAHPEIMCRLADVFFLVGGTQTNATVIDAMICGYESVVAVQTGHVAVHEAGAIEASGHKVLTLPSHEGKMSSEDLAAMLPDQLRQQYQRGAQGPTGKGFHHGGQEYVLCL